jgi:outer membrane immunogenic protein
VKKFVAVATAIAAFGFVNSASAADMPTKAPAPMMAPVYNWTGFYVGANAGYAWGRANTATVSPGLPFSAPPADAIYSAAESPNVNTRGFTGGVQAGYNQQMNNIVWGIETDFNAFGLRGSADTTVTPPGNVQVLSHTDVKTDWLWTLRPRVGFASGPWLVYATGGLAVTQIKYSQTNTYVGLVPSEVGSMSTTKAGWTAGAGAEMMLTHNWSVKAEYLYVSFGTNSTTVVNPINVATNFSHATDLKASIARLGLNYKF